MSNYSKTTDFAAKDALTTGNANKIVKGTEIDDEFSAIQTAVNSKANTNSPALTGVPTSPTATPSTNNTKVSHTAYVTSAITTAIAEVKLALYPVGSIYTQAGVATNPATLLGFGTWTSFGSGRVMVGLDGGNTLFDTVEETGGSADINISGTTDPHTLTIDEIPAHTHTARKQNFGTALVEGSGQARNADGVTGSTGGGQGHTHGITFDGTDVNYQPFITVYMWKRTA